MGFRFVDGERASKLEALDANPPAPPQGAHVRVRGWGRDGYRWYAVVDRDLKELSRWTGPKALERAERDCARYRRAAGEVA